MAFPGLHSLALWSLVIAAICALWTVSDLAHYPQKMWIMNLVWPLTMLYGSVLALGFYYLAGRNRKSGAPRHGQPPFWHAALKGSMHCGAGCALGDFAGDWLAFLAGWAFLGSLLFTHYVFDFILAYVFGIVFQYFAIVPMRKLGFGAGLAAALKADTISLIAYEIGMFVGMALGHAYLPALKPTMPAYWLMMQLAMLLGLITTFPVNAWLIHKGIKEAM